MAAPPMGAPTAATEQSPPAVVVGLDCITGLQTARLLAARGVPVIGIAADRTHFCARTRVPRSIHEAPTSGEPLVTELLRLAPTLPRPGIAMLLPCTDAAVLTISTARDRLGESYRFVLPEHDVLDSLTDKVRFVELGQRLGLPMPASRILRTRADAEEAASVLEYPVVLKPPIKTPEWLANVRAKVVPVRDRAALLAAFDRLSPWAEALVAQSWVDGGEDALFSCNAYFDRSGTPQATFVARKIRQWPLDVGTSCLGVEVRDDVVLDTTLRLFSGIGYRGLAYLELKRDARTGAYAIIEPNLGRPTGRSAIAERGGVDLLLTAYNDALGRPLPETRHQRYAGVKWIYWRHDIQASLVRVRRGELGVRDWWASIRGPRIEAVGSLRDPLPFVFDLLHTARQALRALRRRATPRRRPRPTAAPSGG